MRHAVSVLQSRRLLFKLRRIFEKPIAVGAIQEASREPSGPFRQFPPSCGLYFEVGFAGHELHTGSYAVSYAHAAIVVANHSENGPVRRVARLRRCGDSSATIFRSSPNERMTSWTPLLGTTIWSSGVAPTTRCGSSRPCSFRRRRMSASASRMISPRIAAASCTGMSRFKPLERQPSTAWRCPAHRICGLAQLASALVHCNLS